MAEDKVDYLTVDDKIPGQNYVLLSFCSPPNDVLELKESFIFEKFIRHWSKYYVQPENDESLKERAEEIKTQRLEEWDKMLREPSEFLQAYKEYKLTYGKDLQEDINKELKSRNNMRAVKVRGVYDSIEETQRNAARLQKLDRSFHIFSGQVGYWLPFDPDPNQIQDQQYMESQLNDLIKTYNNNQSDTKEFFEERRQELLEDAMKKNKKVLEEQKKNVKSLTSTDSTSVVEGAGEGGAGEGGAGEGEGENVASILEELEKPRILTSSERENKNIDEI